MAETGGILGTIIAAKQEELASRLSGFSLAALRDRAQPTTRSLCHALSRPGARFIFEIKRASPSVGAIRAGANAETIARGYVGVADALSVLTDSRFFGGALADVTAARRVFDGPILAKDFFLDPRQVVEARIAGADAILVMMSVLDDATASDLIAEARRLGMDALVEVHDETEMRRALALGAPLIGINNRDLRDLSVDLSTTERLAAMASNRILISESGIITRADVDRLAPHVEGFLVGSSLMCADDPGEAARALAFGRVKLCGLNRPEDMVTAAPAAFAGFIFVPESPRRVTLEQALRLRGDNPKSVGIFRDMSVRQVADAAHNLALHAVQLHGKEDDEYLRTLRPMLPAGTGIWRATTVDTGAPPGCSLADRLLFDSGSGGTGRTFDWRMVRDHPDLPRALVAGGIGSANVREAARLGAYALDIGSAVDARPGVKSATKIAAVFDALRPPSRNELRACA